MHRVRSTELTHPLVIGDWDLVKPKGFFPPIFYFLALRNYVRTSYFRFKSLGLSRDLKSNSRGKQTPHSRLHSSLL